MTATIAAPLPTATSAQSSAAAHQLVLNVINKTDALVTKLATLDSAKPVQLQVLQAAPNGRATVQLGNLQLDVKASIPVKPGDVIQANLQQQGSAIKLVQSPTTPQGQGQGQSQESQTTTSNSGNNGNTALPTQQAQSTTTKPPTPGPTPTTSAPTTVAANATNTAAVSATPQRTTLPQTANTPSPGQTAQTTNNPTVAGTPVTSQQAAPTAQTTTTSQGQIAARALPPTTSQPSSASQSATLTTQATAPTSTQASSTPNAQSVAPPAAANTAAPTTQTTAATTPQQPTPAANQTAIQSPPARPNTTSARLTTPPPAPQTTSVPQPASTSATAAATAAATASVKPIGLSPSTPAVLLAGQQTLTSIFKAGTQTTKTEHAPSAKDAPANKTDRPGVRAAYPDQKPLPSNLSSIANSAKAPTDSTIQQVSAIRSAGPDNTDGWEIAKPSALDLSIDMPLKGNDAAANIHITIWKDEDANSATQQDDMWLLQFSIKDKETKPIHIQTRFVQGNLSIAIWAEDSEFAANLSTNREDLAQSLETNGLTLANLTIRRGKPATIRHQQHKNLDVSA